jgi:hypothetical protein
MFASPAAGWYHSNQYNGQAACQHCGGIIRHEQWCITCNPVVGYAFGVVLEPERLTLLDRLILHALGASWPTKGCDGTCKQTASANERQPQPSWP